MPWARSRSRKASMGWLEWPIEKMGIAVAHNSDLDHTRVGAMAGIGLGNAASWRAPASIPRPLSRPMQDAQDDDLPLLYRVDDDIRQAGNHQFTGSFLPPWSPQMREVGQPLHG